MTRCDYLICGAGIAGASLACELAPHGAVLIAEQEDSAGYHTTGRSAAMYIQSYGAPAVRCLTAASRAFFDAPPTGFTDYPLLTPRACLTIASAEQVGALDALAAELRAGATRFIEIGADQARAMVPALEAKAAMRALVEPDAADIDTNALHSGFLKLARSRGARLVTRAGLETIEKTPEGWRVGMAGGESVEARVIVNAAGAWCDSVAAMAGAARLGLEPKRRTAVLFDPPAGMEIESWPAVIDVAEQLYFKPQSGLLLASPADETPSPALDAAPEELDIAICIDRVQQVLAFPIRRVTRAWAGLRTFAPDRAPVVGYDAETPGFFWLGGQGGFGMQTSPALARLAAALALDRPVPADLAAAGVTPRTFSPSRFAPGRA